MFISWLLAIKLVSFFYVIVTICLRINLTHSSSIAGACSNTTSCNDNCKSLVDYFEKEVQSSSWGVRHPSLVKHYKSQNCQVCVEIGIARGELAQALLTNVPQIKTYYGVDPFLGGYDANDVFSLLLQARNASTDWADAVNHRLQEFGCRFKLYHGKSYDMVKYFVDKSVDCVFIDGDHTYEGAKLDIDMWFPILKPGGTLFFDDVTMVFMGVVQAVDEFAMKHNLKVVQANGHGNYYIKLNT